MASQQKVISAEDAARLPGRRVFTNGVFDILHAGHVRYLQAARALGDSLIVGLNSDRSARALKGDLHPIVPQAERAEMLAALACVDWVVVFDELTAERVVSRIRPEVYVKGGDYQAGEIRGKKDSKAISSVKVPPEARIVEAYGGHVEFIPFVAGHSTTNLIAEILKRYR